MYLELLENTPVCYITGVLNNEYKIISGINMLKCIYRELNVSVENVEEKVTVMIKELNNSLLEISEDLKYHRKTLMRTNEDYRRCVNKIKEKEESYVNLSNKLSKYKILEEKEELDKVGKQELIKKYLEKSGGKIAMKEIIEKSNGKLRKSDFINLGGYKKIKKDWNSSNVKEISIRLD